MRHTYKYIPCALGALLALTSCDNIDEQDRLIPVERPHSEKVVLIEEFTGARCVNCPNGAAEIHGMLEAYGDNLVAVSLYPSQLANLTTPLTTDLRTEAASEYFSAYNGTSLGLPAAMIDRTPVGGQVLQVVVGTWSTAVESALLEVPPVSISVTGDYDASSRNLAVTYNVEYTDPVQDEVYIQLYLVENDIESMQMSTTGLQLHYMNQHVLRTPINGTWGTSLGANHLPESTSTGAASVTLNSAWKAENCQIVAYVYRASDRRVLQAHLLKSIVG